MSWPLAEELAVLHRPEALEHVDHVAGTPASRRCVQASSASALLAEPPFEPLDALPLLLASALEAPRTAMALDGGERRLGPLALLALDQLGDGDSAPSAR